MRGSPARLPVVSSCVRSCCPVFLRNRGGRGNEKLQWPRSHRDHPRRYSWALSVPSPPESSRGSPRLTRPESQVWSQARHAWWLIAYPVVLTLAPGPTRSLIGRAGSSGRALSTRWSHGDPSLRTGLSGGASISLLLSEPASFLSSAPKGSQLPCGVSNSRSAPCPC